MIRKQHPRKQPVRSAVWMISLEKKIGVQLGTTGDIYVSDYENDGSGTTVERYNKGADAVQALKQGKIDCVVIDEQPALAFVEENPGLKILDEEFTLEEYAIVIAKGNDDLLEKVNTALEELRSEGTLDRITKIILEQMQKKEIIHTNHRMCPGGMEH